MKADVNGKEDGRVEDEKDERRVPGGVVNNRDVPKGKARYTCLLARNSTHMTCLHSGEPLYEG